MLAKILHEITNFSDDTSVNLENYMESITFINNVYSFINRLKMVISLESVSFRPSFKGRLTCEKFNLSSDVEENEMRCFVLESALFLEDKNNTVELIKNEIRDLYETIEQDGKSLKIILK